MVKTQYNESRTPRLKFFSKDYIWHLAFIHCPLTQVSHFSYLVYNYVTYKFFWIYLDPISYIWCIHVLYHLKTNYFGSSHIFKIYNFQNQKHIWTKSAKMCYKHELHSIHVDLLLINIKIIFDFEMKCCIFDTKKWLSIANKI